MATIDLHYPHKLALDEAARRCRKAVDKFNADHPSYAVTWKPSGLEAGATGTGFKGNFTVNAREILASIDLSVFLRPVKKMVEASLRRRLDEEFGGPA
jgi:hypothetical protein